MSKMSDADVQVREAIKHIRELEAAAEAWTEENEHICGFDDARWFDTIAAHDAAIAQAGIELANLMEQLIGDVSSL